jgi:hypothetical protein
VPLGSEKVTAPDGDGPQLSVVELGAPLVPAAPPIAEEAAPPAVAPEPAVPPLTVLVLPALALPPLAPPVATTFEPPFPGPEPPNVALEPPPANDEPPVACAPEAPAVPPSDVAGMSFDFDAQPPCIDASNQSETVAARERGPEKQSCIARSVANETQLASPM